MAKKKRKKNETLLFIAPAVGFGVGTYFFVKWLSNLPTREQKVEALVGGVVGVGVANLLALDWLKENLEASWGTTAGFFVGGIVGNAAYPIFRDDEPVASQLPSGPASSPTTPAFTRVGLGLGSTTPINWSGTPEDQILRANPTTALLEVDREEQITPAQRRLYDRAWALLAQWANQNVAQGNMPGLRWYGDLRVDLPALQQAAVGVSPPDRPGRLDNHTMNAVREGFVEMVQRGNIR